MRFTDRADAGRRLAERLRTELAPGTVVLGLPRGGVPVAYEVARVLGLALDVVVVRKLGLPAQPELAMGAVGEGVRVLNETVLRRARVDAADLAAVEARERAEVERRTLALRAGRPAVSVDGRDVVIVDDGVATGATARAACEVLRARGARSVVLAAPVGPAAAPGALAGAADRVVLLHAPAEFGAVGQFYLDFGQTADEEVTALLALADELDRG
ncbi:MAG: putative phosphoribosyl transferase [Pseudonocardiales bacterium]|nr:putative phosphoribosyl transferase [Pseudonocardiales bacterium]